MRHILIGLFFLQLACTRIDTVASRYLKSQHIVASEGGDLTVLESESAELAGFSLAIPPGALAQDTQVTLELGLDALVESPDTPQSSVAMLGPTSVVLLKPVKVAFPYVPEEEQHADDVQLVFVKESQRERLRVVTDAQVTISLNAFGSMQVISRRCVSNDSCTSGVCLAGRCRSQSCGNVTCTGSDTCCNASCGICTPPATSCSQVPCAQTCADSECGAIIALPACTCPSGEPCSPNQCVRGVNGTCVWKQGDCL